MNRSSRRRAAATGARRARAGFKGLVPVLAGGLATVALAGSYLWALGGPVAPGIAPGAAIGGHWALTRTDGTIVTDRDFRGRYVLLFFGYTDCPDICPTTLSAVADALRVLGNDADRLQPVFVTVDPSRDTPAVVRDYVRSFSDRLVGLTGTPAEVATVEREYRVRSVRTAASAPGAAPSIDHTAVLLLIGPDGRFLAPFPPDEDGRQLAGRLHRYLS